MKGFNRDSVLLYRDLKDVTPMRFNLLVRIHDETPKSGKVILPDQAYDVTEHTRARHGTIVSMGPMVADSEVAEGILEVGSYIIFDESVSVDDPNRCFRYRNPDRKADEVHIMFTVDTVMAVLWPIGEHPVDLYIDSVGRFKIALMRDLVLVKRTEVHDRLVRGIWIPAYGKKPAVGGVVQSTGRGVGSVAVEYDVGDKVLFEKYGATDIVICGVRYGILPQNKVLATVTGDLERGEEFNERRPVEDPVIEAEPVEKVDYAEAESAGS